MKKDDTCIFCKIIAGEIPCSKIYEDEHIFAFLDIMPINRGHTLVVPKNHSKNILEDDDKDICACMKAVKEIGKSFIGYIGADGFNIGVNTERAAGQAVFHTHFHVIPRFSDDGLHHWPGGKYEEGDMEKVREKIVSGLNTQIIL